MHPRLLGPRKREQNELAIEVERRSRFVQVLVRQHERPAAALRAQALEVALVLRDEQPVAIAGELVDRGVGSTLAQQIARASDFVAEAHESVFDVTRRVLVE